MRYLGKERMKYDLTTIGGGSAAFAAAIHDRARGAMLVLDECLT